MKHSRKTILHATSSPLGILRQLPKAQAHFTPPTPDEFAKQLEIIASKRQLDMERVLAARAKQARKNAERIKSHG